MGGVDEDIEGYYSPCLVPLQMQLFSNIPTKLKSLIRLVKYWKQERLVSTNVPLSDIFEQ